MKATTTDKVVLVCNSTKMLSVLEEMCICEEWTFNRLDGQTPLKNRQQLVDQFNKADSEFKYLFLLSSKAGG